MHRKQKTLLITLNCSHCLLTQLMLNLLLSIRLQQHTASAQKKNFLTRVSNQIQSVFLLVQKISMILFRTLTKHSKQQQNKKFLNHSIYLLLLHERKNVNKKTIFRISPPGSGIWPFSLLFTRHYPARCFGMNMPKSRDIQREFMRLA